jgi:hypothetical protein
MFCRRSELIPGRVVASKRSQGGNIESRGSRISTMVRCDAVRR